MTKLGPGIYIHKDEMAETLWCSKGQAMARVLLKKLFSKAQLKDGNICNDGTCRGTTLVPPIVEAIKGNYSLT